MDFELCNLRVLYAYHIVVNEKIISIIKKARYSKFIPMTAFHTLSQHSNPLDPGHGFILRFIHARVVRCWFPTLACSLCVASRNRLSFFLFHYLKSLICFGRVFLVYSGYPGDPDSISRLAVIWGSRFVGSILCSERFFPGYSCFRISVSSKTCI